MQATISMPYSIVGDIFDEDLLRIAEKLLGLQPGDGPQALRMIHSLVHITGRSLMSDVADDSLLPLEDRYRHQDEISEIRFHHKSFIDYLLTRNPSRSLECCVDLEKMNTRLALACIFTMQIFSLQPTSRIACITRGYATLCWTHLVTGPGIPQRTLSQALMSFDLFACYLDTLGPASRPSTVISKISTPSFVSGLDISSPRRPKKDIIDKTCPNSFDIKVAREFLLSILGAQYDFVISGYHQGIVEKVANWMRTNPDSPRELIRQYQVFSAITRVLRFAGPFPSLTTISGSSTVGRTRKTC